MAEKPGRRPRSIPGLQTAGLQAPRIKRHEWEEPMDEATFDRWTRAFAPRRGRRPLLAALAGGALGLLGRGGPNDAAADIPPGTCLLPGRGCRLASQCCSLECRGRRCGCAEIGDSCRASEGCCWGYCHAVDSRRAYCTCAVRGRRCAAFKECCSGRCNLNGRCTCSRLGQSCTLAMHCCGGHVCREGRCVRR